MPLELEQPVSVVSVDAAISVLLCLFHSCATQAQYQPSPRLAQLIYRHLEGSTQRDDLPEVLKRTCDELSDAWQSRFEIEGRP